MNYALNGFQWSGGAYIFQSAAYERIKFISIKLGPVIKLPINKVEAFRFYYQLCPTHSWNGEWSYNSGGYRQLDYARFILDKGNGLKNEIGIEYTNKKFILSACWNFGKLNYKNISYYRTTSVYYPQAYALFINSANVTFESKAKSSFLGISMGIVF